MKRLGAVLCLVLALAPASLRAGDEFKGHFNYGDVHFTPKDAVAIENFAFEKGTTLLFTDFALDRQAILDAVDAWSPIHAQAKAAKGRVVAIYVGDRGCYVQYGLTDGDNRDRFAFASSVKINGRRATGTCAGQFDRLSPALDFSFTVDLPVSVSMPPARIDPRTGEQAVVVQALMSALAASDWDTARRYLPTNAGPPTFATPEIKESFFRGLARSYPSQMVLDEGWVKGSECQASFTGATIDGARIERGRVTLHKMDGTWRVLRPSFVRPSAPPAQ